jgi:hypothetical protein
LRTWELLEGLIKMSAEDLDLLKIWARLEGRNGPKEGGNFIIGDGCIHGAHRVVLTNCLGYLELLRVQQWKRYYN